MRLFLLFAAVSFLSVLLQTTLLHLLPLGPVVPDLILILCVYWGVNHPTVGAVLGCFLLGYSVDVFSSPLLGLNALAMSLVFLAVYLSSRHIWVQNPLSSVAVVFLASLVKGAVLLAVWTFFLPMDGLWIGLIKYIFLDALIAALLAPWLFSLLRRGHSYLQESTISL